MDRSKNPLAEAHKVYVPYCTSDAHMGSVSATKQTFGWHFQGQNVVKAVIQVLVCRSGILEDTKLGVCFFRGLACASNFCVFGSGSLFFKMVGSDLNLAFSFLLCLI